MDFQDILLVACYERRLINRSFTFMLLCFVGIIGISAFHLFAHSIWRTFPFQVDIPAAMPYVNAYLFCVFQSFALLFLGGDFLKRDIKYNTNDVFFSRPIGNAEYILGKFLALVQFFLMLAVVIGGIAWAINLFASKAVCNFGYYVFYFLTLTLPVTLFVAAFTILVRVYIKNQALSLFFLFVFWGGTVLLLPHFLHGAFDFLAAGIPNTFSAIVGHPALGSYLVQRLMFVSCSFCCIVFIIRKYPRASNFLFLSSRTGKIGIIAGGMIVLCIWLFLYPFYQMNKVRKNYVEIYKYYDSLPKVSVRTHDITFRQEKDRYLASSRLEIENMNEKTIDTLLFYLNPGLNVSGLRISGKNYSFRRHEQIVLVPYSLGTKEKCVLEMDYGGALTSDICYPDIPDDNFYRLDRMDFFLNPGRHYMYLTSDYTLITPEVLWYPTSAPVVNMTQPYLAVSDYTIYTLRVINPFGQMVISPGKKNVQGDTICFYNDLPLVGISLVCGDLERMCIESDSGRFECYYTKGKALLQGIQDVSDEGKKWGVERVWRFIPQLTVSREKYPFDKMVLVEHPLGYMSFQRPWKSISNYACPEVYFFPEKKDRVRVNFNEMLAQSTVYDNLLKIEEEFFFEKFRPFLRARFPKIPQELFSILSKDYPLMNGIISAFDWDPRFKRHDRSRVLNEMEALEYLSRNSLAEAIRDPDAFDMMDVIIQLKSEQLREYILTQTTWDTLSNFMSGFVDKYRYQNIHGETLCKDFYESTRVDILPWMNKCYNEKGIPRFVIQEPNTYFTSSGEETIVYLSFKIWNKGNLDGCVSLWQEDGFSPSFFLENKHDFDRIFVFHRKNGWKEWIFKSIFIPLGKGMDICIPVDTLPMVINDARNYFGIMGRGYKLSYIFSGNYPGDYGFESQLRPLPSSKDTGVFELDTSLFLPPPGIIIVDNEDPGFRIFEEQLLFSRSLEKRKYSKHSPPLPRWALFIDRESYGDVVRSFYCKGAGGGKAKLEWSASIQEGGMYELFVYYQWALNDPVWFANQPLHHYTFHHGEVKDDIFLEPKGIERNVTIRYADGGEEKAKAESFSYWIPVGKYVLAPGDVKLVLHDNGLAAGQMLYADAVKWVKVE